MATEQINYSEGDASSEESKVYLTQTEQTADFFSNDLTGINKFSAATFELEAIEDVAGTLNVYIQRLLGKTDSWMDIAAIQITGTSDRTIDIVSGGNTISTPGDRVLSLDSVLTVMLGNVNRIYAVVSSGTWSLVARATYYP